MPDPLRQRFGPALLAGAAGAMMYAQVAGTPAPDRDVAPMVVQATPVAMHAIPTTVSRGAVVAPGAIGEINCSGEVDAVADSVAHVAGRLGTSVRTLIATVPDPWDSTVGWFFDDQVAAIQQAMNAAGYVMHCYSLPWKALGRDTKGAHDDVAARTPGVIVAHKPRKPQPQKDPEQPPTDQQEDELLMLFLVGETPTSGVHVAALERAIDVVTKHGFLRQGTVDLMAPTFSGTAWSLRIALRAYPALPFRIISGSATRDQTQQDLEERKNVTFHATVNTSTALMGALLNYLAAQGVSGKRVALLYESGTLYGKSATLPLALRLPFPMQISQVRTAYERDAAARSSRVPQKVLQTERDELTLALDDITAPRDRIPPLTPELTAISADLLVSTILTTLSNAGVTHVIVLATDPRDTLFLARRIRQYAPDVQLATLSADLLHVHREYRRDLEGMIVATTYPLIATVQPWQSSRPQLADVLPFPRNIAEGAYNAALALLGPTLDAPLVDYLPPRLGGIESCGGGPAARIPQKPPVWLTLVAHDRFLPLKTCVPADSDYVLAGEGPSADPAGVSLPFPILAALVLLAGILVAVAVATPFLVPSEASARPGDNDRPARTEDASPRHVSWKGAQRVLWTAVLVAALVGVAAYFGRFAWIWWFQGTQPVDKILLYMRATDVATGRSLLSLAMLIAAVFCVTAICQLRRLKLLDLAQLANPLALPETCTHDLLTLNDHITNILWPRFPPPPAVLAVAAMAAGVGSYILWMLRLEGGVFDIVISVLMILAFLLVLSTGVHTVVLWRMIRRLLRRLARHPLTEAYGRLKDDGATRGLRMRFYARLPVLYDLAYPVMAWRALAIAASSPSEPGKEATIADGWQSLGIGDVGEVERCFAEELRKSDMRRDADGAATRTRLRCSELARDLVPVLENVWRSMSAKTRLECERVRRAEEFVAAAVVVYLGVLFMQLRNLLTMLVLGSFLLIFIVLSYPFQPQSLLTTAAWVYLALVLGIVLMVVAEMDRDHVLNQLSGTASGQLTLDRNLGGMVTRYVALPLLGLLATQIPQLSRFIDALFRSLH